MTPFRALVALSMRVAGGRPLRPVASPGGIKLADVLAPALPAAPGQPGPAHPSQVRLAEFCATEKTMASV